MDSNNAGVANVFMFAEPLACWRDVSVRTRKTKIDWAGEMARLLEGRYAGCEKVIVVCDNLNTHTMGAFYEAFEPSRARASVSRIEFHYTPLTRQLAAHRGERVELPNGPMRIGSSDRKRTGTTGANDCVV